MNPGFSLIGARTDLGLAIRWRFSFLDAGSVVSRSSDVLYLDVGGHLEPGVIDHHQGAPGATSAARLVFTHPDLVHEHLVGPWIAIARTNEIRGRTWLPTIGLHQAPDFDALVSAALAIELVETGRFPHRASDLVKYTDRVDQGAERPPLPEGRAELYPLILVLQNLPRDPANRLQSGLPDEMPTREDLARISLLASTPEDLQARWRDLDDGERTLQRLSEWSRHPHASELASARFDELTVRLGLHLIRAWLDHGADALARDPMAQHLAAALEVDTNRFRAAAARLEPLGITLPSVDLTARPIDSVDAAILPLAPRDSVDRGAVACDKIYLRGGVVCLDRRFPVTVIEKLPPKTPAGSPQRSRWIIAIDESSPPSEGEARANLRGLGASLEWAEQRRRRDALGLGSTRRGASRFPEFPGIADPWYDGRGHQWTIIESPREGTVLGQQDIAAILTSRFWEPEVAAVAAWIWRWESGRESWTIARHPLAAFDRPATTESPRRTGDVLKEIRSLQASNEPEYGLLVWRLCSGWDPEVEEREIRTLVGRSATRVVLDAGHAYLGPRFAVIAVEGRDVSFEPDASIDALLRISRVIRELAARAGDLETDHPEADAIGLSRELRLRFVKEIADYRSLEGARDPDVAAIRRELESALRLDERIDSIAQLLEHLDDDAKRSFDGRLNRLIFVLALLGVLDALVGGLIAFEAGWIGGDASGVFHLSWSLAVLIMAVVLIVMLATLPLGRFSKLYATLPVVGPLLFPERRRLMRQSRTSAAGRNAAESRG